MAEEPTATARFRAELTGAWAEFLASLFFVFFGAGSVCGAVKAVGEPVVVEPINYAASFGFAITFLAFAIGDVSGGHINPADAPVDGAAFAGGARRTMQERIKVRGEHGDREARRVVWRIAPANWATLS